MEFDNPVIYGLEFQTRALSAQNAETDIVRFLVGTQSMKLNNNQVHLVELNDETNKIRTQVYNHNVGEIWSLQASPMDPSQLITSYSTLNDEGMSIMKGALWKLPDGDIDTNNIEKLNKIGDIDTTPYGNELKTIVYHPIEGDKVVSVVDNKFILWNLNEASPQASTVGTLMTKGQPRFTTGKWNPHNNCNQFVTLNDNNIRGWDLRSPNDEAWSILSAHSQVIRDLDFNANKQYILSTCGDDCFMKFWDIRNSKEAIISRMEHSHWVWSIKINRFHDQLVLTSSSDSRVILCSIPSVSSEPYCQTVNDDDISTIEESTTPPPNKLDDGVIGKYEEHEDSVYAVEWSSADPWTFASLSYDGRLVINKVPRKYKYKILL